LRQEKISATPLFENRRRVEDETFDAARRVLLEELCDLGETTIASAF
jgi:hypothetical protein